MSEPAAREAKPDWADLPQALRVKIAALVGDEIASAETAWGGFGPSATFVLRTRAGRRFFCKGAHSGQTSMGRAALLRERENLSAFPELAQFGSNYLGPADEGDWQMMLLGHIERAKPVPPWDRESFESAIALLARFHKAMPARAPRLLQKAGEATTFSLFTGELGWGSLARDEQSRLRFLELLDDDGPAWFNKNAEQLAAHENGAANIGGPHSWVHLDVRSDNLLFVSGGGVVLVDWPALAYGPVLLDLAFFLPSVAGEGGASPRNGVERYESAAGLRFRRDDVAIAAATISGFFAARAGEPDVPQLPRLRWVQRLQLFPALDWTCSLLGIEPPKRKPG